MSNIVTSVDLLHPKQIYFHESHENKRLEKICHTIEKEGVLRNPPMVSELSNGNYLLLDGAHRMMAMIKLGCKRVPVQIVPDKKVQIRAWNHILPSGEWLHTLKKEQKILWSSNPIPGKQLLVHIVDEDKREHFLYSKEIISNLFTHLEIWHYIVSLYQNDYRVCRHSNDSTVFPNVGEVLVEFPEYSLNELKSVVTNNCLMPAGVTRTIISGRLLNLRIPLHLLLTEIYPAAEWEALCYNWSHSLRMYDEPIYVYEG